MEHFDAVRTSSGVREFTLRSNGLRVLFVEDHSSPTVMTMVTYHVGSRNEAIGYTGATHLLEHMMFKGSKAFNKKLGTSVWTVLQNQGASINATTWKDRTNYYSLLPAEHFETAVAVEADRMRHAFIRDEDRVPEMVVVRNEFEQGENSPYRVLDKAIWAAAYVAHPYHCTTIGWRSDIEGVSTERLREFYNTFYHPNNATLTLVGDLSCAAALAAVHKHFAVHPRAPAPIPPVYTTEPPQQGPRTVTVHRAGAAGIVGIAHKHCKALHVDAPAVRVLGTILGTGKMSRLYKKLIDTNVCTRVRASPTTFRDEGLFITYAWVAPDHAHNEVERIVLDEYARVQSEGVTAEEVERAVQKELANMAFSRDGPMRVAAALNEAIARGDWRLYTYMPDLLRAVTPADVQRVAQTYLVDDARTIGHFVPRSTPPATPGAAGAAGAAEAIDFDAMEHTTRSVSEAGADSRLASRVVERTPVPGVDVLVCKTGVQNVVSIKGSLVGGSMHSLARGGSCAIGDLCVDMLDKGTTKHSKFALSELIEGVGASIRFGCEPYRTHFTAKCLAKDVGLVIELLAEQLRTPAFDAEEFAKAKKQMVGDLEKSKESTRLGAWSALSQRLYPAEHPNYIDNLDESIRMFNEVTLEQVQHFHARHFGTGGMVLVAVGDVDADTFAEHVRTHFDGWAAASADVTPPVCNVTPLPAPDAAVHVVEKRDKASVSVYMGSPVPIDRLHDDYVPLFVALYVLGGNFSARLMQTVRDEQGLTYGVGARVSGVDDGATGYVLVTAEFAPELLVKGRDAVLEQLRKLMADGVTADELAAKQACLVGQFAVSLATTEGLSTRLRANYHRGRAVAWLDEYPARIQALTPERVNAVLKQYVALDKLQVVACGSIDDTLQPLEK